MFNTSSNGNGGGSFDVRGGAFRANLDPGAAAALTSSIIDVSDLGGPAAAASNFLYTSNMTIQLIDPPSSGNKSYDVGLAALVTNLSGGDVNNGYLLRLRMFGTGSAQSSIGDIIIEEIASGSSTALNTGSFTGSLSQGTTLSLSLLGEYTGGDLKLTFSVSDGTTTNSVIATDTTPQTGTGFGYRNRLTGNDNGEFTVDYDNFSISVPEPSSLALLGLGTLLLLPRRR